MKRYPTATEDPLAASFRPRLGRTRGVPRSNEKRKQGNATHLPDIALPATSCTPLLSHRTRGVSLLLAGVRTKPVPTSVSCMKLETKETL